MKKFNVLILVTALFSLWNIFAQGFVNLNFENATFTPGRFGGTVSATNAIPGWTPYYAGGAANFINSNGVSLGGAMISLEDTNNRQYPQVQGKYFLLLQAGFSGDSSSVSVGQTGQIPLTAQSLVFWGYVSPSVQISFNGNPLTVANIGAGPNIYSIYQADISPYAGQIGELLFTSPYTSVATVAILDNIQFSTTPVPEPGTLALVGLGAVGLGWRWRKRN